MRIQTGSAFVELEPTDYCDLQGRADLACRIAVFCDGFGGAVDSVWFAEEDRKAFVEQLEALEKTRQGAAELFNMSSGTPSSELEFTIFSTDTLGHLALRTSLQKI